MVSEKSLCVAASNERAASLVEYTLLVVLIALVAIVSMRALGSKVSQQFSTFGDQL